MSAAFLRGGVAASFVQALANVPFDMCSDAAIHIALWHPGVKQAAPLRRQNRQGVDRNQQKSTIIARKSPKSRQEIDKSHQLSTEVKHSFNRNRSAVQGMPGDHRRKTHVLEHKGLWRRCAMLLQASSYFSEGRMWRLLLQMWHKCATADSSTLLGSSTV